MRGSLLPATVFFIALVAAFVAEYWPLLLTVAVIVALGGVTMKEVFRRRSRTPQPKGFPCPEKHNRTRRRTSMPKRQKGEKANQEPRTRSDRDTTTLEEEFRADRELLLQPKHVRRKNGRSNDPWYDGPRHGVHRVSKSERIDGAAVQWEQAPPATTAWYSAKGNVYHNNASCRRGRKIRSEYMRTGEGGRKLCANCAVLSGIVGGRRRNPPRTGDG